MTVAPGSKDPADVSAESGIGQPFLNRMTEPPPLRNRDLVLLRLVKQHGGVPRLPKQGRGTAFWMTIQQALNAERPPGAKRFTTWHAPLMAYRRLQEQLRRRGSR
jgi:hypothetical protein